MIGMLGENARAGMVREVHAPHACELSIQLVAVWAHPLLHAFRRAIAT